MDVGVEEHINIDKLKDISDNFRSRLEALEKLSKYRTGKVGIYNDRIYLSWNWFQGFQRQYYGESREKVLSYIIKIFNEYFIFYKMLETAWLYEKSLELDDERLENTIRLRQLNYEQMDKWYIGLGFLSKQYYGDKKTTEQIEEVREKIYHVLKSF
tara:strand:- start:2032 stop:2499 length:468 start_codon:yes stop_codon:yes gene_type:complete